MPDVTPSSNPEFDPFELKTPPAPVSSTLADLEAQIIKKENSKKVPASAADFARDFLIAQGHEGFVAALDGLVDSLGKCGRAVTVEYHRRLKADGSVDKVEPPFAVITATQMIGHELKYSIPDINRVLNPSIPRGGSEKGPKQVITENGTSTRGQDGESRAYPILLEDFSHPAQLVVTTPTGEMLERNPVDGATVGLEAKAAFSPEALIEAFEHVRPAVIPPAHDDLIGLLERVPYSYVYHELAAVKAGVELEKRTAMQFERRDEFTVNDIVVDPDAKLLVIEATYPDHKRLDNPVTLRGHVKLNGPFVDMEVEAINRRAPRCVWPDSSAM